MSNQLTPITITIAESRLAGFQFLSNDLGIEIAHLVASRVFTEFTIPENFTLPCLESYSDGIPGARISLTLHFNQKAIDLIQRISFLLGREMNCLAGSLADVAGEVVNAEVADHLHGRSPAEDLAGNKEETERFMEATAAGVLWGGCGKNAWAEIGLQPTHS